jgi:hypothetical protein
VVAEEGEGRLLQQEKDDRSAEMKYRTSNRNVLRLVCLASCLATTNIASTVNLVAQQSSAKDAGTKTSTDTTTGKAEQFSTAQNAADTLISAAEKFDTTQLIKIFGTKGADLVLTGEFPQDRQRATDFAALAKQKMSVSVEPKNGTRAFVLVGDDDWPFPVPLVKTGNKWAFDADAGRRELLYRRIGANELDAIQICHGYVEAQEEYSLQKREGYEVNQYAQRIISTPGKKDGLVWQNPDGTFGGPIGEKIAQAIAEGYTSKAEPYHGYYFKILKGQGPAAPLGQLDYVINGAMIGGFALVAAPAEYFVTGVKTFMVSQDGVVYQKDLGPTTLEAFEKMDRFNPDKTWTPVEDDSD